MIASDFVAELAIATKEQIAAVVAPLVERIAVLEAQLAAAPAVDVIAAKAALLVPKPRDGQDAAPADVYIVAAKAAALIPTPKDGQDGKNGQDAQPVDVEAIAAKAVAPVRERIAAAEAVNEKLFASYIELRGKYDELSAKKAIPGEPGKDGKDGRDVDAALLETVVAAHVTKAVAALPRPKDGTSPTPDDLGPLVAAEVAKAVAALPKAKDGRGVHAAVITHDGKLALTFSDGGQAEVGPVVGAAGKDADMVALQKQITDEVAAIPRPKDGAPGVDGLGFDDMDAVIDDEKGFLFRWARGERVKEKAVPMVLDRGVYKPGVLYRKGAAVTAQGSLWIAQADTRERPGDGSTSWRLAVKKGRDGRDRGPAE